VPIRRRIWPFATRDLLIVTADSWFPRSAGYPDRPRSLARVFDIDVRCLRRRAPQSAVIVFQPATQVGRPKPVSFRLRRVQEIVMQTELTSRDDAERLAMLLEERRRAAQDVETSGEPLPPVL